MIWFFARDHLFKIWLKLPFIYKYKEYYKCNIMFLYCVRQNIKHNVYKNSFLLLFFRSFYFATVLMTKLIDILSEILIKYVYSSKLTACYLFFPAQYFESWFAFIPKNSSVSVIKLLWFHDRKFKSLIILHLVNVKNYYIWKILLKPNTYLFIFVSLN